MAELEALATRAVGYMHELLHSEAANDTMAQVHGLLARAGVPKPYPDAERLAIALATGLFTLLAYFVLFGKRHRRRRRILQEELELAYRKVQELQDKLAEAEDEDDEPKEQIRIWMDGAFDMMHYGHMNAFRQARALGTYLVVGVNDDESITLCKGAPPVLNNGTAQLAIILSFFVSSTRRWYPQPIEHLLTLLLADLQRSALPLSRDASSSMWSSRTARTS